MLVTLIIVIVFCIYFKDNFRAWSDYARKRTDVYVLEQEVELRERANQAHQEIQQMAKDSNYRDTEQLISELLFQARMQRKLQRHEQRKLMYDLDKQLDKDWKNFLNSKEA